MAGHHGKSRQITERVHIGGKLVLQTPAHFGSGQAQGDALVDMTLLMDEVDGRALILGSTIAGALRNYLRERLRGYFKPELKEDADSAIAVLFGPVRESKEVTDQSLLIVDDALADKQGTTLRDGVRIDPATATAWIKETKDPEGKMRKEGGKFDIELLQAGSTFDLHLELALTDKRQADVVLPYVAAALEGLEKGEIRLGARKRRGYGKCQVRSWTVSRYELTDPADLCAWLNTPAHEHRPDADCGPIAQALGTSADTTDARERFAIQATFSLAGSSLLIRSGFGRADVGPDMEHLHALDEHGKRVPVISGTSWAGVIRHRALRIANTIADGDKEAEGQAGEIVNRLFGWMPEGQSNGEGGSQAEEETGQASKVTLDETAIVNGQSLYQTRVRIDRFTGGAYEGALFEQAPVYGKQDTMVDLRLQVRDPAPHEMGLLLLVLKDLWTGDLPVGGEASVGRGRLKGITATVTLPDESASELVQAEEALGLTEEQRDRLQGFVTALWSSILGAEEAGHE